MNASAERSSGLTLVNFAAACDCRGGAIRAADEARALMKPMASAGGEGPSRMAGCAWLNQQQSV